MSRLPQTAGQGRGRRGSPSPGPCNDSPRGPPDTRTHMRAAARGAWGREGTWAQRLAPNSGVPDSAAPDAAYILRDGTGFQSDSESKNSFKINV